MKRYNLLTVLCLLLLVVGCGKDRIDYNQEGNGSNGAGAEYGYLIMPNAIYVDLSHETISAIESKATPTKEEASDDYLVTITKDSDGEVVFDDTYGNFKQAGKIALRPTAYTLYIRSTDNVASVGDKAEYSLVKKFVIVGDVDTELDDLACTLSNIKVSITFTVELLDSFQEDGDDVEKNLKAKVSVGDATFDFNRESNGDAIYFAAPESSNTLSVALSGMYNTAAADSAPVYEWFEDWQQSFTGVKAGQWRNISINVEHTDEGNADFKITINSWLYDDGIIVDVTDSDFQGSMVEAEMDDPENYINDEGAPVVSQGTQSTPLDLGFKINRSSFSLDASLAPVCTNPLILNVEPQDGATLSEMWVEFTSDNADFVSYLQDACGAKCREYIFPQSEASQYYTIEGNSVAATYAGMYKLYVHEGAHRATIMTKDSQGRASYNTLEIEVSNDGADIPVSDPPAIELTSGGSFDDEHVIDPIEGLDVEISITSQSGITGFVLEIESTILSQELLQFAGLDSKMDLVNPGACEASLREFRLPVMEEVEGQTALNLNLTEFMSMLLDLGSSQSNFVMYVTDAGGTTAKTLSVKVE